MKIGSGTITGRIASPDTGRVKEYELTLKDISTEAETAGGEVKGRISSPDTGRVGDYTFTLDEVIAEGDLTNGTVKGRIASPDTGNVGTYKLQLKDFQIEGGGGKTVEEKDVNFIDYDGTLVDSYTKDEFLALNALPANPTHEGLTSQGWNWSLEDAKTYLEKYGTNVTIGQMYITDDGATRLYCEFSEFAKNPYIGVYLNGTIEIDWGDGSEKSIVSGTNLATYVYENHSYASAGKYVISIKVISGSFVIMGTSSGPTLIKCDAGYTVTANDKVYLTSLKNIEVGNNVKIKDHAFFCCYSLETITLPEGSVDKIQDRAFANCRSLKTITIPAGVTSMLATYAFSECSVLETIAIPKGIASIGTYVFSNDSSLRAITIPEGVKAIGNYAFQYCNSLKALIMPEDANEIGSNAFYSSKGLKTVKISEGLKTIGANAFQGCNSLETAIIPDSVTSISQNVFNTCQMLKTVTIPKGVKNIPSNAFLSCTSLESVTIPENVTSIGGGAFSYVNSVFEFHVLPTTPPSISSSSFSGIRADCKIYVPADSINAYKNASYWSTYADKIVGE